MISKSDWRCGSKFATAWIFVGRILSVSSSLLVACLTLAVHPRRATGQSMQRTPANPPLTVQVRVNSRDGLQYVWILPGSFIMGCSTGDMECRPSEQPSHEVTITKGFWIGQSEATVAAYQRYASVTSRQMPFAPIFNPGWQDHGMPIINISWEEANAFCTWSGGRLPSEAEWEYAARGGNLHARYGQLDEIAWYGGNSGSRAHDVAQKRPNNYGLYDTLGNVWEWVNDWFDDDYYQNSPRLDPRGPAKGQYHYRVLRGGSWFYFPRFVRVSVRLAGRPEDRVGNFGVRCVADFPDP